MEAYGVDATPEVNEHQIAEDDAFVLLASDGLFEFLTSQQAIHDNKMLSSATHRQQPHVQVVHDIWQKLESGSSLQEALWGAVRRSANIWKEYDQAPSPPDLETLR